MVSRFDLASERSSTTRRNGIDLNPFAGLQHCPARSGRTRYADSIARQSISAFLHFRSEFLDCLIPQMNPPIPRTTRCQGSWDPPKPVSWATGQILGHFGPKCCWIFLEQASTHRRASIRRIRWSLHPSATSITKEISTWSLCSRPRKF